MNAASKLAAMAKVLETPVKSKPGKNFSLESELTSKNDVVIIIICKNNVFCNFTELSAGFRLPSSHLFRHFQIRYRVKSLFPMFTQTPPTQMWDEFLQFDPSQKSHISRIYRLLLSSEETHTTEVEGELEHSKIVGGTLCARLTLIQF